MKHACMINPAKFKINLKKYFQIFTSTNIYMRGVCMKILANVYTVTFFLLQALLTGIF